MNILLVYPPYSHFSIYFLFFCQAPEQDEVLQSIDRAIEGIHNVALKNGGKYNLEQRDVLQSVTMLLL